MLDNLDKTKSKTVCTFEIYIDKQDKTDIITKQENDENLRTYVNVSDLLPPTQRSRLEK